MTACAGNFFGFIDNILFLLCKEWLGHRRREPCKGTVAVVRLVRLGLGLSLFVHFLPGTLYGGQRGPAKRGEVPLGPAPKRLNRSFSLSCIVIHRGCRTCHRYSDINVFVFFVLKYCSRQRKRERSERSWFFLVKAFLRLPWCEAVTKHVHVVCHASSAESMSFRLVAKKIRVKLRPNPQLRPVQSNDQTIFCVKWPESRSCCHIYI